MLTRKQSWRRRSIVGSAIVRDSHHDFLYFEGLTADVDSIPMRSLSEPIFSNRCNLCNASSTRSVDNFGSAQENKSLCECSVINKRKADKDKSSENNKKKVKFHLNVRVVLIPTKNEYEIAGLTNLIWWDETDYITFRDSAANELKQVVEMLNLDVKDAIKVLYQPCDSVESADLYVKTQVEDYEADDVDAHQEDFQYHSTSHGDSYNYGYGSNTACGITLSLCDLHKKTEEHSNKQHCVTFKNYVAVRASDISTPSSSAASSRHLNSSESILSTTGTISPASDAHRSSHSSYQYQKKSESEDACSKSTTHDGSSKNLEILLSFTRGSVMNQQQGHPNYPSCIAESPKVANVEEGIMSSYSHYIAVEESVSSSRAVSPSLTETVQIPTLMHAFTNQATLSQSSCYINGFSHPVAISNLEIVVCNGKSSKCSIAKCSSTDDCLGSSEHTTYVSPSVSTSDCCTVTSDGMECNIDKKSLCCVNSFVTVV